MAVVDRARFKPDTFRSTLESLVVNLNASAVPPTGTLYLPVQIISFDDTTILAYKPGDNAVEQLVTIIYEDVISVEIAAYASLGPLEVQNDLQTRLDAWAQSVKPAIPLLRRTIRAAKRLTPREIL